MRRAYQKFIRPIIVVALLASFLVAGDFVLAEDLEKLCQPLLEEETDQACRSLSSEECQSLLNKCLDFYQQKSDYYQGKVKETQQQKKTLQNQVYILKNKIGRLNNEIYRSNLMIKDLSLQIGDTQTSINVSATQIEDSKERLSNFLRLIYEQDNRSLVEIMLAEKELSDFFDELAALEALNVKTQEMLSHIKALKEKLEKEEIFLTQEKGELEQLVTVRTLQKQESQRLKEEQEYFLRLTETEYQKYLKEQKESQAMAAEIRKKIFQLIEVPEAVTFGEAIDLAQHTEKITGVRAAFILAVLWQETRIGQVKGGCYLKNTKTGDGVYIKTGNKAPRTMNPARDIPHFLNIVQELNASGQLTTDAYNTPVSCCMFKNGQLFGWGGAMGPAQFIPSTWMLFKERIEQKSGRVPANPWNIKDAFLANGLYLGDLGATSHTYSKEINAALRYFGCTSWWCKKYYGEPVMTVANCCQEYIDKGTMSPDCQYLIF